MQEGCKHDPLRMLGINKRTNDHIKVRDPQWIKSFFLLEKKTCSDTYKTVRRLYSGLVIAVMTVAGGRRDRA